jgi:capsular exopolysaccharide synthesis family protein
VIDAQKLLEDPEFQDSQRFALLRRLLGRADPAEPSLDERRRVALRKLQENLDIRRVGISYVLDVAFASPDREKAARLANAITDAYLRDIVETRSRAARLGSLWLEERVAELRTQMNAAARKVQEFKAHSDYRIARRDARLGAAGQNDTAEPASASEPTTLEELESTAQILRKIYENFNLAFTDVVQKESYPVSNARIISPATIPIQKSHPKTVLILALGGLIGSLAGFGLALLRGSIEQPVRSAQQVREETGLECLGLVPELGIGATSSFLVRTNRAIRRLVHRSQDAQPANALAEVLDAPFSPFSEGIKRVKTAVSIASRARPLRCIGVISSSPREGKTTVAANLATLFAVSGARTLLVDADVGNPSLTRALAAGADKGLREVLNGTADVADCIAHVKRMGVDLLPVATNGVQPAPDILGSEQVAMLFKSISESYALVIVDLPPLRPVADALAISAVLDGVILIAEWETPLPVLAETLRSLRIAQVGVIGSVLTKVNMRAADRLTRSSRYLFSAS